MFCFKHLHVEIPWKKKRKINRQRHGIPLTDRILLCAQEMNESHNSKETISIREVLFALSTPEWWMLPQHAKGTFQPYIPIKLRCRFSWNLSFSIWFRLVPRSYFFTFLSRFVWCNYWTQKKENFEDLINKALVS